MSMNLTTLKAIYANTSARFSAKLAQATAQWNQYIEPRLQPVKAPVRKTIQQATHKKTAAEKKQYHDTLAARALVTDQKNIKLIKKFKALLETKEFFTDQQAAAHKKLHKTLGIKVDEKTIPIAASALKKQLKQLLKQMKVTESFSKKDKATLRSNVSLLDASIRYEEDQEKAKANDFKTALSSRKNRSELLKINLQKLRKLGLNYNDTHEVASNEINAEKKTRMQLGETIFAKFQFSQAANSLKSKKACADLFSYPHTQMNDDTFLATAAMLSVNDSKINKEELVTRFNNMALEAYQQAFQHLAVLNEGTDSKLLQNAFFTAHELDLSVQYIKTGETSGLATEKQVRPLKTIDTMIDSLEGKCREKIKQQGFDRCMQSSLQAISVGLLCQYFDAYYQQLDAYLYTQDLIKTALKSIGFADEAIETWLKDNAAANTESQETKQPYQAIAETIVKHLQQTYADEYYQLLFHAMPKNDRFPDANIENEIPLAQQLTNTQHMPNRLYNFLHEHFITDWQEVISDDVIIPGYQRLMATDGQFKQDPNINVNAAKTMLEKIKEWNTTVSRQNFPPTLIGRVNTAKVIENNFLLNDL